MYIVYHYPSCSTCKKAIKWLKETGVDFELKHMVEETPSADTLKTYIKTSGLELKKFFNTSGKVYRENNIKEKLPAMSIDQGVELLADNGMLIKRPIIANEATVLVGFKEEVWKEALTF